MPTDIAATSVSADREHETGDDVAPMVFCLLFDTPPARVPCMACRPLHLPSPKR